MEDERIIDLYFERNENAISETASKYGSMIRSISYNILKNKLDSEECENDTYLVTWNKIPPTKPRYLSAFLGRIARNISFDKYAYNKAAKRNTEFDIALSEIENCITSEMSIEDEENQKILADIISNFLKSTSYVKRVIFVRRYWYCDTIIQIADKYGYSESKVKSMLMRTRNDLRKYLRRQGVEIWMTKKYFR